MRVLITGATGFVGRHLVEEMTQKGHQVSCLVRTTSSVAHLRPLHVHLIYGTDRPLIKDFDIIYHVAGVLGKRGIPYHFYTTPAINMTLNLLENMSPSQKFVYMSTHYVELPPITDYNTAKLEGEKVTAYYCKKYGIDYRIIRPGFIYGKYDYHHLPLFQTINRLGKFFPIVGSGKNLVRPTFIDDVTYLTTHAFNYHQSILRISGEPLTMNTFINTLAHFLDKPRPWIHIPPIPFEPFYSILKVHFFTADQGHFQSTIDPTSLYNGLRKSIQWYKEEL